MTPTHRMRRRLGALVASLIMSMAYAAPASATQILVAADHAELTAEISAAGVSRVALMGDRIARVIRIPSGYQVDHDPGSGDLYLRPLRAGAGMTNRTEPVVLFVGSEKGFTYRLALTPVERGPAQILIRNPEIAAMVEQQAASGADPRIASIVRLIRAVANRETLAGYALEAGGADSPNAAGMGVVEVWRGPRLSALVLELGAAAPGDAAALAARLGPDIAAIWLPEPGAGLEDGRLAVAVRVADRSPGQAGGSR